MKLNFLIAMAALMLTYSVAGTARSSKVYDGYVETVEGEKIMGSIKMLSPALNEVKVKFVTKVDNKKITFKAEQLNAYAFQVLSWDAELKAYKTEWVNYVRQKVVRPSVAFSSTEALLYQEQQGAINLYHHFIERNSNSPETLARELLVAKGEHELTAITKSNYAAFLKEIMADYPELTAKIGTKGYGIKYVSKVIKEYNDWAILQKEIS